MIDKGGVANFTDGRFPADWSTHHCPNRVSTCKYCSAAVLVLHQPPDSAEELAVLEAEPDPSGVFVIDCNGHAVLDPDFTMAGERFRWHTGHGGAR